MDITDAEKKTLIGVYAAAFISNECDRMSREQYIKLLERMIVIAKELSK